MALRVIRRSWYLALVLVLAAALAGCGSNDSASTTTATAIGESPSGECAEQSDVTGTVASWSDPKGYGFIAPDDGGSNVFVHHSDLTNYGFKTLSEGQQVTFDVTCVNGRARAVNVRAA